MSPRFLKPLFALALAGLTAAPALSEDAAPEAPKGTESPFLYASSGDKAAHDAALPDEAGAKVIGGELAADGAWPWQVALTVANMPVSTDSQFCGGTVVLDTWVLTAAHCVHMMDDQGEEFDVQPNGISIVVGTNKLDGSGDRVPVEKIFVNPQYSASQFDFVIALIKLARKPTVPYKTIEVHDAAFGDILQQPGVTTIVSGWGLQNGARPSAELRQTTIQMMDREQGNASMMEARAEEAVNGFAYAAEGSGSLCSMVVAPGVGCRKGADSGTRRMPVQPSRAGAAGSSSTTSCTRARARPSPQTAVIGTNNNR